ncbi:hypothetical protein PCE1_003273 [Barthelona sp. PCE]
MSRRHGYATFDSQPTQPPHNQQPTSPPVGTVGQPFTAGGPINNQPFVAQHPVSTGVQEPFDPVGRPTRQDAVPFSAPLVAGAVGTMDQPKQQGTLTADEVKVAEKPHDFIYPVCNYLPTSPSLLNEVGFPQGFLVRIFDTDHEVPTVNLPHVPRCRSCKAYISPYAQFVRGGHGFVCSICGSESEVPPAYFNSASVNGPPEMKSAELVNDTVEFYASPELYANSETGLTPPTFAFIIDGSVRARQVGFTDTVCEALLDSLDYITLPRVKVAIICTDVHVHTYSISNENCLLKHTLPNVDKMLFPVPSHELLIDLETNRAEVEQIINSIKNDSPISAGSCIGSGITFGASVTRSVSARILVFIAGNPTAGLLRPSKPGNLTEAFEMSAQQLSRYYLTVSLYAGMDTCPVNFGRLSHATGGTVSWFNMTKKHYQQRVYNQVLHELAGYIGFDAVLRVRVQAPFNVQGYHGAFTVGSRNLVTIPTISDDFTCGIHLGMNGEVKSVNQRIHIQVACLYTRIDSVRLIRVTNIVLPVTPHAKTVLSSITQPNLMAFFVKMNNKSDKYFDMVAKGLACYRKHSPRTQPTNLLIPDQLKTLIVDLAALMKMYGPWMQKKNAAAKAWFTLRALTTTIDATCMMLRQPLFVLNADSLKSPVGEVAADGSVILPPEKRHAQEWLQTEADPKVIVVQTGPTLVLHGNIPGVCEFGDGELQFGDNDLGVRCENIISALIAEQEEFGGIAAPEILFNHLQPHLYEGKMYEGDFNTRELATKLQKTILDIVDE